MFKREQKCWSWIPTGFEISNFRVGEDKQQYNRPTDVWLAKTLKLGSGQENGPSSEKATVIT
jgi:hypothetical protein